MTPRPLLPLLVALAACSARPQEGASGDDSAPDSVAWGVKASGTVFGTDGEGLNVRAEASPEAAIVGHLAEGAKVGIGCQQQGPAVGGNSIWDYVSKKGGFVADAYVWTGYTAWIP